MKRTYQPSNIKRARKHGFLKRMSTKQGRKIVNRRRAKGRKRLAVQPIGNLYLSALSSRLEQDAEGLYFLRKFSFTKADRILNRAEFVQLSKTGTKLQNRHFIAIYLPGRFDRSRLGITVSRRVGKAVTRNRIKRFAREYFRLNRQEMTGNWDINLIVKKEAAGLSSQEVFLSLQDIFRKIGASGQ